MDAERDVYEELLTQAEIQGNVNKVNRKLLVNLLFVPILVVLTPAIHPDSSLLFQCLILWLQWSRHYIVVMRTSSTRRSHPQRWVCSPSSQRTKAGTSNSWWLIEKLRIR